MGIKLPTVEMDIARLLQADIAFQARVGDITIIYPVSDAGAETLSRLKLRLIELDSGLQAYASVIRTEDIVDFFKNRHEIDLERVSVPKTSP